MIVLAQSLIVPPVPAIAPSIVTPTASVPSGDIVGVAQAPFVGLSLQNAVAMALAKNTDLAVAQENRRIARYQIVAAKGAYDVRLQIEPSYAYGQQSVINPFFAGPGAMPSEQSALGGSAGFSGQTLDGTHYGLSASASRTDNNTTINSYDPTYATALSLQLSRPLSRGASMDDAKRQLELARVGGDLSNDQALLAASGTLVNVLDAYYDLVAGRRNVAIQEDALRLAKEQSEKNRRLIKQGAAAPLDAAESDAQVYTYQNNVFSALQNVARLQNKLKQLTLADPADPLWLADIVPTSAQAPAQPEPALDDLIVAALKNRPEIAQLRESERGANIDLAYAKGQVKPQLDVTLGITENGFAGAPSNQALSPFPLTGSPVPPAYQTGKLGQAWTNAFNGRFPEYTLGAVIGLPLRNRTAQGNLGAASVQKQSMETQRIALLQRIQVEARNAVQGYRSARARLIAASAERAAAERVLQGEERKFTNGQSTTFFVLQRQVSVAAARGNELQAQTDLQEALVEIDRVGGTIFRRYGVDVSKLGST
jgi:HAE1 family hydrophobic/amphiphilic exporter-1